MSDPPTPRPHSERAFVLGTRGLSDPQSSSSRIVLIEVAIAVLVIFALSGLYYLELWRTAANDLTRILPDETLVWADSPPPWANLERVLTFDRWDADPIVREQRLRQGFLATEPLGEVFGLPLEQIRQISRAADSLSFAVVPTDGDPSAMIFAEVRDLVARKRAAARLAPFLEQVDRHMGFRVETVRRSPWLRYTGADGVAPRVVALDPYVLFAWGGEDGLESLLEARVGGERAALRYRAGFEAVAQGRREGDLVAFADPVVLWDLLVGAAAEGASGRPRAVDGLDVVTGHARLSDDDEAFEVRARVAALDGAERLDLALVNRRHELLDLAPTHAPWAVSVVTENPLATLSAVRELVTRLARDLGGSEGGRAIGERLAAVELEAIVRLDWEVASSFSGEVAVMAMPLDGDGDGAERSGGGWALLGRFERPDIVEGALDRLLPFVLGDDYSFGRVRVAHRELYVVRRADAGEEGAPDTPEILAWWFEDGLLELAPRVEVLERLRTLRRSGLTYGDTREAARALADLPEETAAVALLHPRFLAGLDAPAVALVGERLDGRFRIALTLTAELPWLRLDANVGPWSLGAALATAEREEVDALTLPGLDARCRDAHRAMCRMFPDAVPCRPLSLGRLRHVQRACDALLDDGRGGL